MSWLVCLSLVTVILCSCPVRSELGHNGRQLPHDSRVNWNVDGNGKNVHGCRISTDKYCHLHFYKSSLYYFQDKILIGAKNSLLVFDNCFNPIRTVHWPSAIANATECLRVRSEPQKETDCENYIKFVQILPNDPSRLVICGTYSLFRACLTVNASQILSSGPSINFTEKFQLYSVPSKTPFFAGRASDDSIMTFLDDQRSVVLSASPVDSNSAYRISFTNLTVDKEDTSKLHYQSLQYMNNGQTLFLQSPVEFRDYFTSNYFNATEASDGLVDNGELDFMFFLFNEVAIEDTVGEKVQYARVGRLCRNDQGHKQSKRMYFNTFVKARLACKVESLGGTRRHEGRMFYYDRITAGYFHKGTSIGSHEEWNTDQVFYGGFSGHGLGPKGSAICVFNATRSPPGQHNRGIFDIFSADYYNSQNKKPDTNSNPFRCTDEPRTIEEASKHVLIHRPAIPINDVPLVVLDGYIINALVVDTVPTMRNTPEGTSIVPQDVIFAGMDTGELVKLYIQQTNSHLRRGQPFKPTFAEIIELEDNQPITEIKMKDIDSKTYLYVISHSSAYRLPLHRCSQYKTCRACVKSRDPYCVWDMLEMKCGTLPSNTANVTERFLQRLEDGDPGSCTDPTPQVSVSDSSASLFTSTSFSKTEILQVTPSPSSAIHTVDTPNVGGIGDSVKITSNASGITLFIIGILFLILGAGLSFISCAIMYQNRKPLTNRTESPNSKRFSGKFDNFDITEDGRSCTLNSEYIQTLMANNPLPAITITEPTPPGPRKATVEKPDAIVQNGHIQSSHSPHQAEHPSKRDSVDLDLHRVPSIRKPDPAEKMHSAHHPCAISSILPESLSLDNGSSVHLSDTCLSQESTA